MMLATEQTFADLAFADLATLAEVVGRSQIVVAQPERAVLKVAAYLPAGFEDVDIAVLEWIAAEGRRASLSLLHL